MLPLVAAKVAADPTHELSLAHSEALQRAAEAAQVAPGTGSAHPLPLFRCHSQLPQQPQHQPPATQQEIPAAQQQQPDGVEPQQQEATKQQQPATQQQDVDMQEQQPQQQQQQQQPSLMSFVSGVVGRLNYTFSDLQYAALWGEDPIPDRPGTFHLSGLQEGYRFDEISRMMRRLGFNAVGVRSHATCSACTVGCACTCDIVRGQQQTRSDSVAEAAGASGAVQCVKPFVLQLLAPDNTAAPMPDPNLMCLAAAPASCIVCRDLCPCRRVSLLWTPAAA